MKLNCPICFNPLFLKEKSFCCVKNHTFDLSKTGYLNLSPTHSAKNSGDDKTMVQARASFLQKEYYLPLKKQLNSIITSLHPSNLVDCACGNGYYTKDFPCDDVVGIDLSKDAILYASKHDKKTQYVISSIFKLPFEDQSVDCITVLFAPIPEEEIQRVLKPNGQLIVVSAAKKHLFELKEILYQDAYYNDELAPLSSLIRSTTTEVKEIISLESQEDIQHLFTMTPYYYKTSKNDKEKLDSLQSLSTTIHFSITQYKKK